MMKWCLYAGVFAPFVAAPVAYGIGKKKKAVRDYFAMVFTGLELAVLLCLFLDVARTGSAGSSVIRIDDVCGMGLTFALDGFRCLYSVVAGFMWFISTLCLKEYFAHYQNRNRYYFFLLVTLGATVGVFFSADLFTTFVFFELMSFASYVWVAQDERKESLRAAATYLAVAVIGGLVMLMGIFLFYHTAWSSPLFQQGQVVCYSDMKDLYYTLSPAERKTLFIGGLCLLFGFGAKAGVFPLHIWLPKAHPVAPAPASALLSGILTKTGVFGILMLSAYAFFGQAAWGKLLLFLGVVTMVLGALLALLSVDLKRTLACSSVSQIGFILVGIAMAVLLGEQSLPAVRGGLLHMLNHSLLKLVLFLTAGVIYQNTHKLNLNDIRGFGRKKPLLQGIFLMGALGITGVPFWNGYVSKTLIHESIVEYMELCEEGVLPSVLSFTTLKSVEWLFLISGGLTVAYMVKLYVALFVERNASIEIQEKYDALKGKYMGATTAAALGGAAVLLPVLGIFPGKVAGKAADLLQSFWNQGQSLIGKEHEMLLDSPPICWFSPENLKGAGISIVIGLLVYFLVVRTILVKKSEENAYCNRLSPYADLENMLYRPLLLYVLPFAGYFVCRVLDSIIDGAVVLLRRTLYKDSPVPHELTEGTRATFFLGTLLNRLTGGGTRRKGKKDYRHILAMDYEEWNEDVTIVGRSLSFGLLLFCIGLTLTVVYLLLSA